MKLIISMIGTAIAASGCAAQQPLIADKQTQYERCTEKIFEYWERKGLRDYGAASYYIGVGGATQKAEILETCGRRPTTQSNRGVAISPQDCNDAYVHLYLNCIGQPTFLETTVAQGYINSLAPTVFDEGRLGSLCDDSTRINREDFGILMCGE
jgi:hypothetical protein